jgi:uncharacterized repeat protein (TIGR03803 family)
MFTKGTIVLAAITLSSFSGSYLSAQVKGSVLYSFGTNGGTSDGSSPLGAVVFDSAGNIYGTTSDGGDYTSDLCPVGCGTVFELSPKAGGGWSETTLHSFTDVEDGFLPLSGLVLDSQGNLYGTTHGSGVSGCQAPECGTVFELTPSLNGTWSETILYSFQGDPDGQSPSNVIFDAAGNLYGTTYDGGVNNLGTVFELSPPLLPGNNWTETILYNFCQVGGPSECLDGAYPYGGVILDSSGNLYGTTSIGGSGRIWGLVYELLPSSAGLWMENVLHTFFNATNGGEPLAGLTFDSTGNLYGTLYSGGLSGDHCIQEIYPPYEVACGGAFRLTPKEGGGWATSTFLFKGNNGGNPDTALVLDGSSVYGTTYRGGNGYGTVFKITGDTENVLYSFCPKSSCAGGSLPGPVTFNAGQLYGVAAAGGAFNQGVVFSIAF